MRAAFFIAEVILLSLVLKALLFWTYLWQLKEYRLRRFWAEYGSPQKLVRFWLGAGGRAFRRPKSTAKSVFIILLAFVPIFSVFMPSLFFLLPPFPALPVRFYIVFLEFSLGVYLAMPFIIFALVILFKLPTRVAKEILYLRAGHMRRGMKELTVIGITGSYGKSSTKEFLAHILSCKFNVLKTPYNINTEAGIAKFMLRHLSPRHQIFVAEIGAYHRGEIKKAASFLRPQVGVLTGISEQHMALFGSLEHTKQAKFELVESLPTDGFAVFNGENSHTVALSQSWPGKKALYHSALLRPDLPPHYRLNLGAAVEVARYMGMSDEEIESAAKTLGADERMIKVFTGKSGTTVIRDAYSENPDGVQAALGMLGVSGEPKKIVIMPCIIELGAAAAKVHYKIGEKIAEIGAEAIITTPDNFTDIKRGGEKRLIASSRSPKATVAPAVGAGGQIRLLTKTTQVLEAIKQEAGSKTAILLEGRLPEAILNYDF